nr:uncharacterized protein LOC129040096 isoform X2 [Pongo pygmaeus]
MMIIPHLLRDKDQRATTATSPRTRQCWGTENEGVQLWAEGHNSTASPASQAGSRFGGFRGSAGESVSWPWRRPALLSLCCPSRMTGVSCFCHYTSHPLHHLLCSYKDPEKWNNRIADLCKQIEELSERKYDMNLGIQQVKIYNLINQLRELP